MSKRKLNGVEQPYVVPQFERKKYTRKNTTPSVRDKWFVVSLKGTLLYEGRGYLDSTKFADSIDLPCKLVTEADYLRDYMTQSNTREGK